MADILVIDDDEMICEMLSHGINMMGHDVKCAHTLHDGLNEANSNKYDLVFLDLGMPDGNGLNYLTKIRNVSSSPEVIIITGAGDPDGAELAVKRGAWDYIEKTSSISAITLPLVRALQYREERQASNETVALNRDGIIGNSQQIMNCLDLLSQAAASDASVLITGETGTGKELFARAIHENSTRSNENFVVVDCTALPETLVESLLFGHIKGAFTGAHEDRQGLIKQADGGTLFLDEIGELPLLLQKSFLRVLQDHRFRPLGSQQEISSDFRLVCATNRNLDEMVQNGQFRKDLQYRIHSFNLEIPPLRERQEDLLSLVLHHLGKICNQYKLGIKGISPEFISALNSYDWPGNVRELLNTLERTLLVARYDHTLFPAHLPNNIRIKIVRASIGGKTDVQDTSVEKTEAHPKHLPKLKEIRETLIAETEEKYLQDLLILTEGDMEESCRISGLRRTRLYDLLKKYNIRKPN